VWETGMHLKAVLAPNRKEIGSPVSDIVDSYYICKKMYENIRAANPDGD
jgi:hypothetical protein